MTKRLAVLAVLLVGCDFYLSGDDDCTQNDTVGTTGIAAVYRDPNTGLCQSFDEGYDCVDSCAPCVRPGYAQPDWGMCYSHCEGLDEQTCSTTSGCFATYTIEPNDSLAFWGCWQTAPSGPIPGSCTNLDAQECSRHDNCIATYAGSTGDAKFVRCGPEPLTYCMNDTDCAAGFCDHTTCWPPPDCDEGAPCETVCYGICIPSGGDPGECDGVVTCERVAPQCPAGTTAGIRDNCYTGYCIPLSQCPFVACEDVATEVTCISRADCSPVYTGSNCTCDMTGCSCQVLTYDGCVTR